MSIIKENSGFGFTEILVAVLLLVTTGAVVFSSASTGARIAQSDYSIASNVARGHLESLYEFVRADRAANNGQPLSLNNSTFPGQGVNTQTLYGQTFTANYVVNPTDAGNNRGNIIDIDGDGQEDYRRVSMNVTWNEGP